eukprot:bmy_13701T0
MAPARAGFGPLPLLLLLGLWMAEDPVSAKPRNMTSARWFETQHVQPRPQRCNTAMQNINKYSSRCKGLNTFCGRHLSDSQHNLKRGRKNCHRSQKPVSLTVCNLTSGRYPDCRYKEEQLHAAYIVACDAPQKGDSRKFKLAPVHLDDVL